MGLFDSISWFQSELVYYDAWLWDTSIEQRIIRELGTKSEKIIGCKNNRVDLDILNGSAYKNKSKNDWTAEVWRGIKTTAFASIHGDYWLRHTSPRVAVYILFHFSLQLLQVICYLLLDPRTTKVTTSDILVPMALGVGLGILHAQITAYDPQRLKRNRHSPPASVDSTADVEPPQSPTPLPTSSLPLPSEVNFSNFVDSIPQPKPVSTWKPDKEVIFSESNHELGTKSEKIIGCKNNRVDLDILNGSAYKNKSKNDWTAEVWRGIKTTAFASIHGDYWLRHTSPRVAVYILFHFSLQLLQVICYLLLDPRTTKVTTSDILVPMALGVGLGILHAQITAYDPQRLKRNRHSPPASVDSTADVEPPQSPTPLPTSSLPLPSEVNFSNFVDSIPQPKPVSTWKPDKEVIFSESNHVTEEISDQTNSQQSIEVKETESGDKLLQDFKEVKNESEASESSNPMPYRRRALSFKIVPSQHETVTSNLDGNSAQDEFPSSSVNSPDEGLGVLEVKIPTYFRKRSASLSPDFCLNLPDPPLEMKILQFKEAKMRGVTDPEVLADIQHQQVQQQQLSPILMNVPEWEGDVEEGDEESGDENVEIAG
nr:hypothetical transcript [Hymenolepis microstoma]